MYALYFLILYKRCSPCHVIPLFKSPILFALLFFPLLRLFLNIRPILKFLIGYMITWFKNLNMHVCRQSNLSPSPHSLSPQFLLLPEPLSRCACVLSCFSHIPLFATPWTAAPLPGSSVHGILQARILEWFAISFSTLSRQSKAVGVLDILPELL